MAQHDFLAQALRAPHHRVAGHGFVRRDEHESFDLRGLRTAQRVPRPDHIRHHSLYRVTLEHGHVLVSGAMKDDFGPLFGEYCAQLVAVSDGDESFADDNSRIYPQLFREVEYSALVDVKQDKASWVEAGNHPAQLRSNGSSRTGHQYGLAANHRF